MAPINGYGYGNGFITHKERSQRIRTGFNTWIDYQSAPEFNLVRSSSMKELVQGVFAKKDAQLGINSSLKSQLQAIYTTDQQPRSRVDSVMRAYGQNSPQ